MRQVVITYSAVCSFAPRSQAAVEAMPYLCVSERNRPTSVRKRLSLTHAGLGRLITGGVELTVLTTVCALPPLHAPSTNIFRSLCYTDA